MTRKIAIEQIIRDFVRKGKLPRNQFLNSKELMEQCIDNARPLTIREKEIILNQVKSNIIMQDA